MSAGGERTHRIPRDGAFGVPQIDIVLQAEPEPGAGAEAAAEAHCGLGGDSGAAINDVGEMLARQPGGRGQRGDRQPARLQIKLGQASTGGLGGRFLMIVEEVDIVRVLSFDLERHPPVAGDRDGMMAAAITIVAMSWLTLMASWFSARSTSALIEGGRRSG